MRPSLPTTATALLALSSVALAQADAPASPSTQLETVSVSGERKAPAPTTVTQDIEAAPASVTVIDRRELDRRSISTYGDMFRRVPGAFVNDYGQGLVAYEVKFRGFGSGHGRDVAFYLDGLPLNVTGSQHTNGYADLAQVIAEIVNRVEIVRGPFSPYAGNHAVAGSVQMYTDREPGSFAKVDIDNFGRVRVLPVYSGALGDGSLLLALDATKGDGYQRQTDLERTNLFARYSFGLGAGQAAIRFQAYDADVEAPGYIDYARVKSGQLSPRDALAPGIGDAKRQNNLVFNYRSDDLEGQGGLATGWQASVYAVDDRRRRWSFYDISNPIGNPVNLGAEQDKMRRAGFDVRKAAMLATGSVPTQLVLGAQYDDERIDGTHFTADPRRRSLGDATVDTDRQVNTRTAAAYALLQISPVDRLKLTLGGRYDHLDFDIRLNPLDDAYGAAGGNRYDSRKSQFSPKLGATWAALEGTHRVDVFANLARGLKSPYPFGDFNRLQSTSITPLRSTEIGLQGNSATAGLSWRVALWNTRQDKEALFNAGNQFIGNQKTDRNGYDLELRWLPRAGLELFGNYSAVRARIKDQPGNAYIANVPDWVGTLGLEAQSLMAGERLDWSLSNEFVGPQPLDGANAASTSSYSRTVGRVAWTPSALPASRVSLAVTHYSNPYQETLFDFGGGQSATSAKPRWKALLSAQYKF
ncbi:TonB-dependent receptor [Methylibium sp. Pch-M]|uniref:TonB-dependent receptor n=1 Tax=Methylibium sp. Pch-M TaxID=2082386 RepID=UPI0013EA354D|nr:TonB-dependent receptor [Methylibium sp. Pch-M]